MSDLVISEAERLRQQRKMTLGDYTAVVKRDGDSWIGWIEQVPGVNCQESSRDELLESLRITEILEDEGIPIKVAGAAESGRQSKPQQREAWDLQCSICGKWQSDGARLIAGPQSYICRECVGACALALAGGEAVGKIIAVLEKEADVRCSFCGKQAVEVSGVVGNAKTRICQECVEHCREILSQ